jgi:D-3-phosphoglycerate dehydrogenase / 2-oxoglutarate reductase
MKIFATAPVPPVANAAFRSLGAIEVAGDRNGGAVGLAGAEVLLVRGTRVDAEMIAAAPRLRIIARTGAGYDGVDIAAATARGIPVLYAPQAGSVPVAEGAFALMLAAAKRLGELGGMVRAGDWSRRYEVDVADLHGATLGIVGFGSIGQEVARVADAFGMSVVAADPAFAPSELLGFVEPVSLDRLAAVADVISLHCALTAETRGLVDRRFLARVKRGAILVNVARGAIVESEDLLLEALEDGSLSAVALDVFTDEPPDPDHPLLAHPRVVCTPHSVGLTARWNTSVFTTLSKSIAQVLRGEMPEHVVNPEALERFAAGQPSG